MKKQILEALRAKFQGVADSVLERIAVRIAKTATTAEEAQAQAEATTIQQVIDSYADSRANEAAQTAVSGYEAKHHIKDGKAIPEPTPAPAPAPQQGGDETPAWAKAIIDDNKALRQTLAQMQSERTATERRRQIESITSKLPEQLRAPYKRVATDGDDAQFGELLKSITEEVDATAAGLQQQGAVFGRPASAGGTPPADKLIQGSADPAKNGLASREAYTARAKKALGL